MVTIHRCGLLCYHLQLEYLEDWTISLFMCNIFTSHGFRANGEWGREGGVTDTKGLRVVTAFGTHSNVGTHTLPGHCWHKLWDTGGAKLTMTGIRAIREIVPVTSLLEAVTVFWLEKEGKTSFIFYFRCFVFSGWTSPLPVCCSSCCRMGTGWVEHLIDFPTAAEGQGERKPPTSIFLPSDLQPKGTTPAKKIFLLIVLPLFIIIILLYIIIILLYIIIY